jgi:hypothetical protein
MAEVNIGSAVSVTSGRRRGFGQHPSWACGGWCAAKAAPKVMGGDLLVYGVGCRRNQRVLRTFVFLGVAGERADVGRDGRVAPMVDV